MPLETSLQDAFNEIERERRVLQERRERLATKMRDPTDAAYGQWEVELKECNSRLLRLIERRESIVDEVAMSLMPRDLGDRPH